MLATMPEAEKLQGQELYEAVTGAALLRKEERCANRCGYCWHDRVQRCICKRACPHSLRTAVNVKVLVLMHSKARLRDLLLPPPLPTSDPNPNPRRSTSTRATTRS